MPINYNKLLRKSLRED